MHKHMHRRAMAVALPAAVFLALSSIAAAQEPVESGGVELLLEVNRHLVITERLERLADSMEAALRRARPRVGVAESNVSDNAARIRLADSNQARRAMAELERLFRQPGTELPFGIVASNITLVQSERGVIEARPNDDALADAVRQATERSIEALRRRIDPTGRGDVSVHPEGEGRILVRARMDPGELRTRMGSIAPLTLHLVDESRDADAPTGQPASEFIYVRFERPDGNEDGLTLVRRPLLTGADFAQAYTMFDVRTSMPTVTLELDSEGANMFCSATRDNVGKRIAIVYGERIVTAPVIEEAICGGRIQIAGSFTEEAARSLASLFIVAALPAVLKVVEERAIGSN